MRIDKITLYHLSMPLIKPFETSFGSSINRDCILIELSSEGLSCWGECVTDRSPGYSYETTGTAWHMIKDFLAPHLLNHELSSPLDFHPLVNTIRGHLMAKSGIEMALWDLYGKINNQSLYKMLGGIRKKVDVGVSVGIQPSVHALIEVIAGYIETGYRRIKIKIKPGRDVTEVYSVRKAFPDIILQIDANSAYTLETAQQLLPLDKLDLLLIEQPLSEDDIWDHSKLQKQFSTPICLDESILTLRHARQAYEMSACRIINIKTGRVGGISQAKAIHDLCNSLKIPVWCGGMLETGVGRAANLAIASLENFRFPADISATDRYYTEDITEERFTLNPDSTIDVPDQPGLGIHIDRHALTKATTEYFSIYKP